MSDGDTGAKDAAGEVDVGIASDVDAADAGSTDAPDVGSPTDAADAPDADSSTGKVDSALEAGSDAAVDVMADVVANPVLRGRIEALGPAPGGDAGIRIVRQGLAVSGATPCNGGVCLSGAGVLP